MSYTVLLHREAKKDIRRLNGNIKNRVIEALDKISENPYSNPNVKPLQGHPNVYRYRVSNYRIVYRVFEDELELLILDAKPRGQVYRRW